MKLILYVLSIFLIGVMVSASNVWDRPVNVLNESALNQTIQYLNNTFFTALNLKLDKTDQRYNDTLFCQAFTISYVASINLTNGTNGLNGTNGMNGIDGVNGTNGLNGLNGTNGLTYTLLPPYLSNNSVNASFNESKLNETIDARTLITALNYSTIILINNTMSVNIPLLNYQITAFHIHPSLVNTSYAVEYNTSSNQVIDRNRIQHIGNWDIEKRYSINETSTITFMNMNQQDMYMIEIDYLHQGTP